MLVTFTDEVYCSGGSQKWRLLPQSWCKIQHKGPLCIAGTGGERLADAFHAVQRGLHGAIQSSVAGAAGDSGTQHGAVAPDDHSHQGHLRATEVAWN